MVLEAGKDYVVVVDPQGEILGYEEKLKAHQKGTLHKAFSIFITNSSGEMLLQQRVSSKYHFAGLWSNTCCSHPTPEESIAEAAHRRLREEMGFDTLLIEAFSFIYKAKDEKSKLIEHELDFVFTGKYDGLIVPNQQEIDAYRWVPLQTLYQEITLHPELFTEWFKIAMKTLREKNLLNSD